MTGVSMGATGAAALGFSNPEKFDAIAVLGGPLDAAYFIRMIDKFGTGGFCTLAELEAIMATGPEKLNDPAVIAGCSQREPTQKWEHSQDFNHWHYTANGTSATRETYIDMFSDITLAYGNFATDNPMSPFAPPGVAAAHMKNPPGDFCTNPVRVKNVYNREYNPTGKYDAITFCDGQPRLWKCRSTNEPVDFCSDPANKLSPLPVAMEQAFAETFCASKGGAEPAHRDADKAFFYAHAGNVDPCRQPVRPLKFALAFDLNGNGRRDYGEPLVKNSHERFDDVGSDGCADAKEDGQGGCTASSGSGDPNGDNYDPDTNALGTENDWLREEGEPYRDDGLDGVPSTNDLGEGNGKHDYASGIAKFLSHDARSNLRKMEPRARSRIDLLIDGGIRDVFNLGVMSRHLFGLIKVLRGEKAVGQYRDFVEIPGMKHPRSGTYHPWTPYWATRVPRDLEVLYGRDPPTPEDILDGEGDHVGTPGQATNRFLTMFNWAAATWPTLERPKTPFGGSSNERQKVESFDSVALGAKWEYAIALPPGYDAPENAEARYPVVFLLHGYGMAPKDFMATSLITDTFVTDPDVKLRPMIMVYPNGRCCWQNETTGARDCREVDETGADVGGAGWRRECESGSFYVNSSGWAPNEGVKYGDAMFELMEHIDGKYRTLEAAEVIER
ncbi:MAG: hypothetical protein JNK82_15670 [Myxococcaceae bacterium]|nr:hypothetical protein [Myxococcaceae bacterium]